MKIRIALLIVIGSVAFVRADDTIASVQQSLKDQGFYFGEITGEKDADTTAAIRRYQIRNGLQITGELNEETLRSIRNSPAVSPPPAPPPPPPPQEQPQTVPPEPPDTSDLRLDSPDDPEIAPPPPVQPFPGSPQDRQFYPRNPAELPPAGGGLFAGTPYENAPPDLQRNVIIEAQTALARQGLYRNEIDGIYGPGTEFSLRAYQSRVGLPVTGRFDLETLAALELLPGAREPVYTPRRIFRPRPYIRPPVRGEWIRE